MPYWNKGEKRWDCKWREILPGDVLVSIESMPYGMPTHFVCFDAGDRIELRDLSNNNIGMCDVCDGSFPCNNSNVLVVGHYKDFPLLLSDDDRKNYFGDDLQTFVVESGTGELRRRFLVEGMG